MRACKPLPALLMTAALLGGFSPAFALAPPEGANTDSLESVTKARNNPAIRGGIVFRAYCILCHGERGDGLSRGAKLYGLLY